MNIPLHCQCGTLQGQVDATLSYCRAICYCRDCQASARFLGRPAGVLDAQGGSDIIATLPASVQFTAGTERLACMSLSDHGPLRWYAACCRTPIGNTPRDRKIAYIGLVRACLAGTNEQLDRAFGAPKIALNTGSAQGPVQSTPVRLFVGVLRIMKRVLGARLSGRYKANPLFHAASGKPIRTPQVLSAAERMALGANP